MRPAPKTIAAERAKVTSSVPPHKLDKVADEETQGLAISKRPQGRGVRRTPPKGKVIGYGE